jgi:hypothetical protein
VSIAQVQQTTGNNPSNPWSVELSSAIAAGNALIVVASNFTGPNLITGVTGGGVTTWHQAAAGSLSSNGTGSAEIWYGLNSTGGSVAVTITTAGGSGGANETYVLSEWSGIGSFDQGSALSNEPSASYVTPTITPTASGELIVGCASGDEMDAATTPFTQLGTYNSMSSGYNGASYYVDSGSSSISTFWSLIGSEPYYCAAIAAFKPATTGQGNFFTAF